jgi:hypothetical protein
LLHFNKAFANRSWQLKISLSDCLFHFFDDFFGSDRFDKTTKIAASVARFAKTRKQFSVF